MSIQYKARRTYEVPSVGGGPSDIVKIVGWDTHENGDRWAVVRFLETVPSRIAVLRDTVRDKAGNVWSGTLCVHPSNMGAEVTL